MAYIVPSDISRLALSGAHSPELDTLRILKSSLPNDYTVFHGVHWSREYAAWTHFGEIDFIVLNRSGDVLLIEQKNGALDETDRGLVKAYEEGDKNVVEQIHRSMDKVRQKFHWQHGRRSQLSADYLVYCPDYRVKNLNAAGLDASRVVDADSRNDLPNRIHTLLGPGVEQRDGLCQTVEQFFLQTFELVPDIHAHVSAQKGAFVRQTGALVDILANLEMDPFRLRVSGTAGSGKSLIAGRFFGRETAKGKRVLLLCYNRPLAERLKANMREGGYVNTWNGFCHVFLESQGRQLDFSTVKSDPEFWQRVQERVTAEVIPDNWLFDALVVDEGQDFEDEWLEIANLFLRDGADILWLEDPVQNLQDKPLVVTEGFVGYHCTVNYRSPESVAHFVRNTLPFEFQPGNDLPGLGVGVQEYGDPEEQPRVVGKVVQDLLRLGFSHDDIVVLACRGVRHSVFSDLVEVGGIKLRQFTGKYDEYGNQVLTEGRLTFDSVYRFKGQEAPAVILVDVDPRADRLEREKRLLYCGMTRATVRLDLVVQRDNPVNRRFLEK